jgi:hypothetical protein
MTKQIGKPGIKCPKYGPKNIIEISYGYPTKERMTLAKQGKIKLGGCEVSPENSNWHCKNCDKDFGKRSVA